MAILVTNPLIIDQLLHWLGYTGRREWITAERVHCAPGQRHTLGQAFREMSVRGAYGLFDERVSKARFTPFVYLATASDRQEAIQIHRRVWSQGVVPFLLILSNDRIWSCNGMAFSSSDWGQVAKEIPWDTASPPDHHALSLIEHLRSFNLRSSISWRDAALDLVNRVDSRLLKSLKALSNALIDGHGSLYKLKPSTANALIGRFLYLYFLVDRHIISQEWIDVRREYAAKPFDINIVDAKACWQTDDFWNLLDELDSVFNGSVFDLAADERQTIAAEHINLVRSVIRHGNKITSSGIQSSFLDFDLGTIRTETLSAVYELFFENQGNDQRDEDGAFYTPPYLVDYVLSRVDDIKPIEKDTKVIDCSCGSGVFLVGSFRRLVERLLESENKDHLPLDTLKTILKNNIFGVEKNRDAAHIAAFSLYLTLLDYLSAAERNIDPKRTREEKLFPSLVGTTIDDRDLFQDRPFPRNFPEKFEWVVGNPPWQKAAKLGEGAQKRADKLKDRIDRDRADQAFFWTAVSEFLQSGGAFGLLLSAKSIISPSADRFPTTLLKEVGLTGIANLTHLRRKLFEDAEHPAIALFGRGVPANDTDPIWVYYPLLSSLPSAKDKAPWCIIHDNAEVETHRRRQLASPDALFRNVMLRRVDRKIAELLEDFCDIGKAISLGDFCKLHDLEFKRGGSPSQTNLSSDKILGVKHGSHNDYRKVLGLEDARQLPLDHKRKKYYLSIEDQQKIKLNHRHQFAGEIIAIPRSMSSIDFIDEPFAFNSGLNSINFRKELGERLSPPQRGTLLGLTAYLRSSFVKYACTLFGRMWFLDARRLEVEDLRRLPLPISSSVDLDISAWANMTDAEITCMAVSHFGLPADYEMAIQEYGQFRVKFQNGKVPDEALDAQQSTDQFKFVLETELTRYLPKGWNATVSVHPLVDRRLAVVKASLGTEEKPRLLDELLADSILAHFDAGNSSIAFDSSYMHIDRSSGDAYLIKPLLKPHWTVERAFTDGHKIFSTFFTRPLLEVPS